MGNIRTSIYEDDGTAPAAWVPRDITSEDFDDVFEDICKESGFLDKVLDYDQMCMITGSPSFTWEMYQTHYFNSPSWFITNKCRQAGGSFMMAAKAFARAILAGSNYNFIFTSYKKEEAINKIEYVRMLLNALPPRFRKKILRDPNQLIEFQNHNGTKAKILSHAQRPIRGINGDIGLDELAFYLAADEVYQSALPAVASVRGNIDIISTPLGKGGKFYDIFADPKSYPEYQRAAIMWWNCPKYLKHGDNIEFMIDAHRNAKNMSVHDRVEKYGNVWLKQQFDNVTMLEDFKQEFEGYFVDSQAAFFTKDLIMSSMFPKIETSYDDYDIHDDDFVHYDQHRRLMKMKPEDAIGRDEDVCAMFKFYKGQRDFHGSPIHFKTYDTVQDLVAAVKRGDISRSLVAGADIGKSHHSTHFIILEEVVLQDQTTLQIERFSINRHNWDLTSQQDFFESILRYGIIKKFHIDKNGLGEQMAQYLKKNFQGVVYPISTGGTGTLGAEMMNNLRLRMDSASIALVLSDLTITSLYQLERHVNERGGISFKADEKKRHHADAAWAIAFASWAGTKQNDSAVASGLTRRSDVRNSNIVVYDYETDGPNIDPMGLYADLVEMSPGSSFDNLSGLASELSPGGFITHFDE